MRSINDFPPEEIIEYAQQELENDEIQFSHDGDDAVIYVDEGTHVWILAEIHIDGEDFLAWKAKTEVQDA